MATKIVTKNSSTASAVPTASDLVQGELAVNVADKRLFTEDNGGSIVELGTNPTTLNVNGTATMDGLNVSGSVAAGAVVATILNSGANGAAQLYLNNDAQNWIVNTRVDDAFSIYNATSNKTPFLIATNGDISFYEDTGTTAKLFWDASAESLTLTNAVSGAGGWNEVLNLEANDYPLIALKSTGSGEVARIGNNGDGSLMFLVNGTDGSVGTTAATIDSAGNVGIGTSSPDQLLQLGSETYGANAIIKTQVDGSDAGDFDAGLHMRSHNDDFGGSIVLESRSSTNDIINFKYHNNSSAGVSAMAIDATNGNVGIGTSAPVTALEISTDGTDQLTLNRADASISTNNTLGGIVVSADDPTANRSGAKIGFTAGANWTTNNFPTNIIFSNDASGTMTERMRIDSSGNVKINAAGSLLIRDDGSFIKEAGGLQIGNTSGTGTTRPILFYTESAERMRIDSSGNLLVGTTTLGDVNNIVTSHLLKGASTQAGAGAVGVYNSTGTANCPAFNVLNADASTDTTNRFMQFYANVSSSGATAMGGIVGNGASNVQFAALSDAREKENITSITGSLDKITSLNPVEFDWIASGEHCKAGFIAQEVEKVFPEFVVENMASEGQEERKGLTGGMTGGIVAHLVKAIQEQQNLIESLTARVAALEE